MVVVLFEEEEEEDEDVLVARELPVMFFASARMPAGVRGYMRVESSKMSREEEEDVTPSGG